MKVELKGFSYVIDEKKLEIGYAISLENDKFQGILAGGQSLHAVTPAVEAALDALALAIRTAMLENLGLEAQETTAPAKPSPTLLDDDVDLET